MGDFVVPFVNSDKLGLERVSFFVLHLLKVHHFDITTETAYYKPAFGLIHDSGYLGLGKTALDDAFGFEVVFLIELDYGDEEV